MKHLTRLSWLLVTVCAWALTAPAQSNSTFSQAEIGSLAEIKNKRRVYVEQSNFNAHDLILEVLAKDPSLAVVSKAEEADFIISYDVDFLDLGNNQRALSGQLVIFTLVENPATKDQRPRVLWAAPKHKVFTTGNTFNQEAVIGGAQEFIKALQSARLDAEVYAGARKPSPPAGAAPAVQPIETKPAAEAKADPTTQPTPKKRKIENGQYLPDPDAVPEPPPAQKRRRIENGRYVP